MFVVLGDVVLGQFGQRRVGIGQRGAGHAPGADGRAQQVHDLGRARQPVAEQQPVQRIQHKALGAAGRSRDHPHVAGPQHAVLQLAQGARAGVDAQGT